MKQFTFLITNEFAMHFGPAGQLAEIAKTYPDSVATLRMGERSADLSRPMKVTTMGVRKGDKVTVEVEGPSENELLEVLHQYFEDKM